MPVQDPALTDLVLEVTVQALAFRAKAIMVVLIINLVKGINIKPVIKVFEVAE